MSGHGWVTLNPDGAKARCGGPGLCSVCQMEEAAKRGWEPYVEPRTSPRKRATYLSVTQAFNLHLACRPLWIAGLHVYLVGSCLHRQDYRDVDLRAIMPDEDYDSMFGNSLMLRDLLAVAVSEWLAARTGLPIDFQFQRRADANEDFDGERHAIGMEAGVWDESQEFA